MTLKAKCQNYAQMFFFTFTPNEWSFEDLTNHLRKTSEDTVDAMACELNRDDDLAVWEPFEAYHPSWLADQLDIMSNQLEGLFK